MKDFGNWKMGMGNPPHVSFHLTFESGGISKVPAFPRHSSPKSLETRSVGAPSSSSDSFPFLEGRKRKQRAQAL